MDRSVRRQTEKRVSSLQASWNTLLIHKMQENVSGNGSDLVSWLLDVKAKEQAVPTDLIIKLTTSCLCLFLFIFFQPKPVQFGWMYFIPLFLLFRQIERETDR